MTAAAGISAASMRAGSARAQSHDSVFLSTIQVGHDPRFTLGLGVNSMTGHPQAPLIDIAQADIESLDSGQGVQYSMDLVDNRSDLESKMGIQVGASVGLLGFGASTKLEFVESLRVHANSLQLLLGVKVFTPGTRLRQYRMSEEARDLLRAAPSKFFATYGDHFVTGITRGGEMYILLQTDAVKVSDFSAARGEITAALLSFAQGETAWETAARQVARKFSLTYKFFRVGTEAPIPNPRDGFEELIRYALNFPTLVRADEKRASYPVLAFVNPVENLTNAGANAKFVDTVPARAQIRRIGQLAGNLLFRQHSLQFAKDNPGLFEKPDVLKIESELRSVGNKIVLLKDIARKVAQSGRTTELSRELQSEANWLPTKRTIPKVDVIWSVLKAGNVQRHKGEMNQSFLMEPLHLIGVTLGSDSAIMLEARLQGWVTDASICIFEPCPVPDVYRYDSGWVENSLFPIEEIRKRNPILFFGVEKVAFRLSGSSKDRFLLRYRYHFRPITEESIRLGKPAEPIPTDWCVSPNELAAPLNVVGIEVSLLPLF